MNASPRTRGTRATRRAAVLLVTLGALLPQAAVGQNLTGMAASSILVVRSMGTATAAMLDEYSPTATLQTAPLRSVTLSTCFVGAASGQAYGGTSANGAYALFTCGTATVGTRQIIRVDGSGGIDASTSYTGPSATYLPRGISSLDGLTLYEGDGALLVAAGGRSVTAVRAFHDAESLRDTRCESPHPRAGYCIYSTKVGTAGTTDLNCVDYYYGQVVRTRYGGAPQPMRTFVAASRHSRAAAPNGITGGTSRVRVRACSRPVLPPAGVHLQRRADAADAGLRELDSAVRDDEHVLLHAAAAALVGEHIQPRDGGV